MFRVYYCICNAIILFINIAQTEIEVAARWSGRVWRIAVYGVKNLLFDLAHCVRVEYSYHVIFTVMLL